MPKKTKDGLVPTLSSKQNEPFLPDIDFRTAVQALIILPLEWWQRPATRPRKLYTGTPLRHPTPCSMSHPRSEEI